MSSVDACDVIEKRVHLEGRGDLESWCFTFYANERLDSRVSVVSFRNWRKIGAKF